MVQLRIIGDVHGMIQEYLDIAKPAQRSLQVGDMGLSYRLLLEGHFNSDHHKFIGGNHEHYPSLLSGSVPHYLGDFGVHEIPDWGEIFFVRGGYSIDQYWRTHGIDWFPEEELDMAECYAALELYKEVRPDVVVTHECPVEVIDFVGIPELKIRPSRTAQLLQSMFEEHQPKLWVFGHHHKDWTESIKGTQFICLGELGFIDIDL